MMIFPLSWPGKVVLILIAIALALIWSMLQWPDWWRKALKNEDFLRRKDEKPPR